MLVEGGILLKWKGLVRTALVMGVVLFAAMFARTQGAKAPTLTALDYAEIEQLSARYVHALDTCADKDWADLFSSDGVVISVADKKRTEGRAALLEFVTAAANRCAQATPLTLKHMVSNLVIEPTPEGATGKSYVLSLKIGKGGMSGEIVFGGKYFDVYVKTPQGWRFKSREIVAAAAP